MTSLSNHWWFDLFSSLSAYILPALPISCPVTKSSNISHTRHPKQTTEHEIKCTKQTSVSKSRDFLVKSLMIWFVFKSLCLYSSSSASSAMILTSRGEGGESSCRPLISLIMWFYKERSRKLNQLFKFVLGPVEQYLFLSSLAAIFWCKVLLHVL